MDAGEAGNRDVFGALLVFVNVLLVLAIVVTSWIATQQSVDDSREGETSFSIAKTMLTAERYAANSARLTRKRAKATTLSVPLSVRPGLPPSDPGLVWRGRTKSRRGQGRNAPATSEDAVPSLERDGSAYIAMVEEEKRGRGDSGSDDNSRPPPSLSATML